MSLIGVIGEFATGTYEVTRAAARVIDSDGRVGAASPSTFEVRASIQPPNGRDLQRLPEGERTDEMLMVYCAEELRTRRADAEPDKISIRGEDYEIRRVEQWDAFGEVHWRAWAAKIGAGP